MPAFKRSLVIGGTGMLADATRWLAARSEASVVIARRASAFTSAERIVTVDADWTHAAFEAQVRAALGKAGCVEAALLWLHEPEPVLRWLLPELTSARVVLVLGGMDGRPTIPPAAAPLATMRLGSVRTPQGRRWLTHQEISAAAIASLEDGESRVAGELASLR